MSWLVIDKPHGPRQTSYWLIDTAAERRHRLVGVFADADQAQAVAEVLAGADPVYRAALTDVSNREPF